MGSGPKEAPRWRLSPNAYARSSRAPRVSAWWIRGAGSWPSRRTNAGCGACSTGSRTALEVDDDLAVHVPAGLELDRRADLLHREGRGQGHSELPLRDQPRDLLDRAGGGVGAVRRRDPVDQGGD